MHGIGSDSGSPFNVQRALHIPNFSREVVDELFQQYAIESGQTVRPEAMDALYDAVRGQPGLTCWFGELLTETYNPDPSRSIGLAQWRRVHARALHTEWNNNLLNLVAKARKPYARELHTLFVSPDVPFSIGKPWCIHLYLNGIITDEAVPNELDQESFICRFASPFVQRRLYEVLLVVFVATERPELVGQLDGTTDTDGVQVHLVAVSWRP